MNSNDCVDRFNELGAKEADKFVVLEKVFIELFECSQEEMKHLTNYNASLNLLRMYDQIWRSFCFKVSEDIHKNLFRKFIIISVQNMKDQTAANVVVFLRAMRELGWLD